MLQQNDHKSFWGHSSTGMQLSFRFVNTNPLSHSQYSTHSAVHIGCISGSPSVAQVGGQAVPQIVHVEFAAQSAFATFAIFSLSKDIWRGNAATRAKAVNDKRRRNCCFDIFCALMAWSLDMIHNCPVFIHKYCGCCCLHQQNIFTDTNIDECKQDWALYQLSRSQVSITFRAFTCWDAFSITLPHKPTVTLTFGHALPIAVMMHAALQFAKPIAIQRAIRAAFDEGGVRRTRKGELGSGVVKI